jgi:hypothetical protein
LGQHKYKHNLQTLLFGNFVTGCTVMMNIELKRFFSEIPNDIYFHDGWMALVAFTFGKAEYIPFPLVRYRKHENNASIAANVKPRNRYRSTMQEILTSIKGKHDFLSIQLETASKFYSQYGSEMTPVTRLYFERFLTLQRKPYLFKKIAFREIVRRFKIR